MCVVVLFCVGCWGVGLVGGACFLFSLPRWLRSLLFLDSIFWNWSSPFDEDENAPVVSSPEASVFVFDEDVGTWILFLHVLLQVFQ